jgi:glycosyltransferase involved in cell wall biosynthesis
MQLALGRFDIYHGPDFVLPASPRMRSVVTVHDLSYVTHPETAHPAQKRYLDSTVPRAIERSSRVITVSEATRADVVAIYGVRPELVHVVHNGLDPFFSEPSSGESLDRARRLVDSIPGFALSVGTVQPRKNLAAMAAAVGLARRRGLDIHFVHAGAEGWLSDEVHSGVADVDDGFVHFLGPVDDRVLKVLYELADVTLAVSKAEGFMLPVIESMAMGTPVITSDVSSMPEVAGPAALLVSPDDPGEIADAVIRVVGQPDLADNLRSAGRLRAAEFTWQAAADKTEAVYRAALKSTNMLPDFTPR